MGVLDIKYSTDAALEKLLQSIDRPGAFCAHGRLFAPMPRPDVDRTGMLSFPVPDVQVRALPPTRMSARPPPVRRLDNALAPDKT